MAKAAAKRCLDDGLLRRVTTEPNGKSATERAAITEKGLAWLMDTQSPKPVLEDLLRVLEERRGQIEDCSRQIRSMAEELKGLQAALTAVLPKVVVTRVTISGESDLSNEIIGTLNDWASAAGQDCPLPELHRRLPSKPPLGTFHDTLRKLHRAGHVYLHPWTAPLYTLPDPSYALLVGHEVAYYASTMNIAANGDRERALSLSVS